MPSANCYGRSYVLPGNYFGNEQYYESRTSGRLKHTGHIAGGRMNWKGARKGLGKVNKFMRAHHVPSAALYLTGHPEAAALTGLLGYGYESYINSKDRRKLTPGMPVYYKNGSTGYTKLLQ